MDDMTRYWDEGVQAQQVVTRLLDWKVVVRSDSDSELTFLI